MITLGLRAQYVGLDPEGGRTDQPGVQTPGMIGSAAIPNPEGVGHDHLTRRGHSDPHCLNGGLRK